MPSRPSSPPAPVTEPAPEAEDAVESGRFDEADAALDLETPPRARRVAEVVSAASNSGRAGFLILNTLGIARRVPVLLPHAADDLRPEGPLTAAQFTDEGVWGVVDLPAFGYAWVPRVSGPGGTAPALGTIGGLGAYIAE